MVCWLQKIFYVNKMYQYFSSGIQFSRQVIVFLLHFFTTTQNYSKMNKKLFLWHDWNSKPKRTRRKCFIEERLVLWNSYRIFFNIILTYLINRGLFDQHFSEMFLEYSMIRNYFNKPYPSRKTIFVANKRIQLYTF